MKFYRGLKPIQAMTFDLDDTLYDNKPVIERAENGLQEWFCLHVPVLSEVSRPQWRQFRRIVLQQQAELHHDVTKIRFAQIRYGALQNGISSDEADDIAQEATNHILQLRSDFTVPQEAHDFLGGWAEKVPLVAITNGNVNTDAIDLTQYFSQVLKAGPDGRAKPYSDMFDTAQVHLNVNAENILHVGDHLNSDVAGAKKAGFQACWMNVRGEGDLRSHCSASLMPDVEIHHLASLNDILHGFAGRA